MKVMTPFEQFSVKITQWIGTPQSIIFHTVLFIGIFALRAFGLHTEDILLILTTAVSLEAIYLAIFIQMTVNRNTQSLEAVEEDIEDIQEDVDELEQDSNQFQNEFKELDTEIEDISEDLEKIQEIDNHPINTLATLKSIEKQIQALSENMTLLKEEVKSIKTKS